MITDELNEIANLLYSSLENLKDIVNEKDSYLFAQWKAGGFIVDTNIMSMYPNAQEVIDKLVEQDDEDDEDIDEDIDDDDIDDGRI